VGNRGAGEGLADETEEGFPAVGDDEAEKLGVGEGYLVGVDGRLCDGRWLVVLWMGLLTIRGEDDGVIFRGCDCQSQVMLCNSVI
jgi:hypothetical protein